MYVPWPSANLYHLHTKTLLPLASLLLADPRCAGEAKQAEATGATDEAGLEGCAAARPRRLYALDKAPPETLAHDALLGAMFDAVVPDAYDRFGTPRPGQWGAGKKQARKRYCFVRAVWGGGAHMLPEVGRGPAAFAAPAAAARALLLLSLRAQPVAKKLLRNTS